MNIPHRARISSCLAFAVGLAVCLSPGRAQERQIHGLTFGMPTAQVTEEAYDGPPVVGEFVTLAPELAKLPPGNRTHDVRFDIIDQEIEVAEGIRYHAWTFGGSVPGPVLHLREGDRVRFTMKNRSAEVVSVTEPTPDDASPFLRSLAALDPQKAKPMAYPMPHAVDFHAATVAMNDKWRIIQPDETIRFEWVANYPGIFLYHCGSSPVFQHMSMGQYGVVVVSPKEGYPTDAEIDREYVIIQSEFYLKPTDAEGIYDLDYDAALRKEATVVAFNGHQGSLIRHPLVAKPGERVRLYVHNVGPTGTSSFHVIGTIFDRVYYEGNPANEMRGMQTVLLGASNGAVVEFILPEAGSYAFVDHEFADAAKGAVGKIVTDPKAPNTDRAGHVH